MKRHPADIIGEIAQAFAPPMSETHPDMFGGFAPKWRPIETAPKDGSYIIAVYRAPPEGYAAHLNGRAFVVRHEGHSPSGYDLGWALFPGFGGVSDKWLSHWMPLPVLPLGPKAIVYPDCGGMK